MAVYDDEDQKTKSDSSAASDDELRRLTGIGRDEEDAMDREAHNGAAADIAERGGLFNKNGDAGESSGETTDQGSGDQLGKGFNDEDKSSGLLAKLKGKSKLKKRLAIAGVVAGGGGGLAMLIFTALLPLKIESLVTNLEQRAGAASNEAMEDTVDFMVTRYIVKYVIPGISSDLCHSTVQATCVGTIDRSDGLFAQIYKGWKNDKLEQRLAKQGLSFGKSGNKFYINTGGKTINFNSADGMADFLNDPNTTRGNRKDVSDAFRQHMKSQTYWKRMYLRFRVAPFVNQKYGTIHCVNACKPINAFKDKTEVKKKAAKAYFIERVVTPLSESYGLILQCVLEGSGCGADKLEDAESGESSRQTEVNHKLQAQLATYAGTLGSKSLDDLVREADDIGKNGLATHLATKLATKIGDTFGFGSQAGKLGTKAIPIVGWILAIGQIAAVLDSIGPIISALSYAANAAAAVQTFTMYQSVAAEMKSGQIDAEQLGSFNEALSTNLSGAEEDRSDATETPLYQQTFSAAAQQSTAFLGGGLLNTAYADTNTSQGYICEDGKPVPAGELVCEEEKLNRGNGVANKISEVFHTITDPIPFFGTLLDVVNGINNLVGSAAEEAFNLACFWKCNDAVKWIGGHLGDFMGWIVNHLVSSPITENMSGGRTFDMMAAGADVSYNASCQENLGCRHVDDETAAVIKDRHMQEEMDKFQQRSMFARMFSTDTPYSFASRLAVYMPSSLRNAGTQVASIVTQNPFSTFGQLFSSLFSPYRVDAAIAAGNPFGVPQNAYLDKDIPKDPEKFWNDNCIDGPEGWWTESAPAGEQLDISQWLNKDENVGMDETTKQPIFKRPNRCQLILASVQSAGGLADPSLLPQDSLNNGTDLGLGSEFRIASFNVRGASHTDGPNRDEPTTPTSTWENRIKLSANVIKSNNIDVIGFQEFEPRQAEYMENALPNYERTTHGKESDGIMWNTEKFTLVRKGSWQTTYFGGPIQEPWVKLKDNATGQELFVLNVHDPINRGQGSAQARYENALKHLKLANKLKAEAPVFLTGDFNSGFTKEFGAGSNSNEKLAYCVLTKDGDMNNAYDLSIPRDAKCPNPPKGGQHNYVDHIYVSPGVQVDSFTEVKRGYQSNGSDHPTVFADVVIPGSSNAGTDFVISTYNVKAATGSRMTKVLNNIRSNKMDIVGFQEVKDSTYRELKDRVSSDYGIYPTSNKYNPRQEISTATKTIIYRKDKFSFVKSDYVEVPVYSHAGRGASCAKGGNDGCADSKIPIIWLRDNQTGQVIIVINTHNSAFPAYARDRKIAAERYTEKIKELVSEGVPIFFTGDFNEGYGIRKAPRSTTFGGDFRNLFYCKMWSTKLLVSAADKANNTGMYCNKGRGIGGVDYIYVSPVVEVEWYKRIAGGNIHTSPAATDHDAHYAHVTVPASGGGAVIDNKAFPLKVTSQEVTNRNRGLFQNGTTSKSGHNYTAYDIMAKSGTPVLSFTSGEVTYLSSDRCGGRLITIYNKQMDLGVTYMHLPSNTPIRMGQTFKAGERIGRVGSGADGCGSPHLHMDVLKGEKIRPACSRLDCDIQSKFVDVGHDLFKLYKALP